MFSSVIWLSESFPIIHSIILQLPPGQLLFTSHQNRLRRCVCQSHARHRQQPRGGEKGVLMEVNINSGERERQRSLRKAEVCLRAELFAVTVAVGLAVTRLPE